MLQWSKIEPSLERLFVFIEQQILYSNEEKFAQLLDKGESQKFKPKTDLLPKKTKTVLTVW